MEGRGENFVKQTKEKDNSGPQPSPQDYQEVYRRFNEERENPSEKKEVNISGNPDTGKETFQQIANSLSNSDRQNFRFYPSCDKTKTPNKREENNDRRGISWSNKVAIGAIILVVLGVLMLLI